MDGIATLANDRVFDQLVALLNSIEVNAGKDMPVCVYPYDGNIARIAEEIKRRPQVQLFANEEVIDRWDAFVKQAWNTHPSARQRWNLIDSPEIYYRMGTHRRFCAFEGPFDRFLYMDADTLLMDDPSYLFNCLSSYDCVVYDYQYKHPQHVYEIASPTLGQVFEKDRVRSEIFCSGFFASHRCLFDCELQQWLLDRLREGEAELLYPMAPDQTLINYMMMRSGRSIYNFALQLPAEKKVGNCVTSTHFQDSDRVLYDSGRKLTYIHYIGIPSQIFQRLCAGENVHFPYRDLFLYYRYLHEPHKVPQFKGKPHDYQQKASVSERVADRLGRWFKGHLLSDRKTV